MGGGGGGWGGGGENVLFKCLVCILKAERMLVCSVCTILREHARCKNLRILYLAICLDRYLFTKNIQFIGRGGKKEYRDVHYYITP